MAANITPSQIIAEEDIIAQIIEHGESIIDIVGGFVDKIRALKAARAAATTAPVPVTATASAPMATDPASMASYDAEQLRTVRSQLAAGLVDDPNGHVAAVLTRRLGSSQSA